MLSLKQTGFNLIEMMIVVLIVAILTIIGLPSVSEWMQNSRTRSVADSLQNGIRFAQGEAARLSRLTTIATTSTSWTVTYTKISGGNDALATTLQQSPSGNLDFVSITPGSPAQAALQFNDLGRVSGSASAGGTFVALTSDASFIVTSTRGPRSLKILVSPSGKVRMCDPGKTFSDTNPDGCPAS